MLALCQVSYILYGCILFTGMWFALIWANYVPVFVNKIDACRPKEERIERITAGTNRFDIVKYMSRSCGNNTQLRLFLFLGLFFSSTNSVISPTQKALAGRHLSLVICSGRIYATSKENISGYSSIPDDSRKEWENRQRANSCCYRSHSGLLNTVSSIKCQESSKSVSTCQSI